MSRTVTGLRQQWRRLQAVPLQALAALGRASGWADRATREIDRASRGRMFETPEAIAWPTASAKPVTAVVPGAYVFPDGTPSDMLGDRLTAALKLYRNGDVACVMVSGGPHEVWGMRAWMRDHDVSALVCDPLGVRTWTTMRRAASLGITRVIVCTQQFHLPRSLFLAQAAGLEALGLVADARPYFGSTYNDSRETCARIRAVIDVHM